MGTAKQMLTEPAGFQTLTDLSYEAAVRTIGRQADSLVAFRMRNHALDEVFYDIGALSPAEVEAARDFRRAEGAILIVYPDKDSGLGLFPSAHAFFECKGNRPRALAVAGVGSSAMGTTAFARNVAQAIGEPVAGVVSGYGMSDLLLEALGGWFWFRTLNKLHRLCAAPDGVQEKQDRMSLLGNAFSPDTATLKDLFMAPEPAFDLIVGHSKGNLSIAEALYQAEATGEPGARALLASAHIVTISAGIYMPERAKRVTDIMGKIDWFGRMNSHPDVEPDIEMPGAWHHTSKTSVTGLDVTKAIEMAMARAAQ